MVFLGTTFCSGRNSLLPSAIKNKPITMVQIYDGVYNHLFLSTNPEDTAAAYTAEWSLATQMNASFDKDLEAGNSGFSTRTTDMVVIRRREVGTTDWMTIYTKEINAVEDFNIYVVDKYARSNTEYEYRVSSYLNGIENSYETESVLSEFDGYYVADKDSMYGTIYDVDGCDTTRNMNSQTLQLLNSKYMTVVSNSETNCDTGSISGTFVRVYENEPSKVDVQATLKYRQDFKNKITGRKPMILKTFDGRIWLIRVTGGISDTQNEHHESRKIAFEWAEIGDVNDMRTLYGYGLSDIESRWW